MLGEERLKGPQRSVFDYVSKEDRERLEEMTGKSIKVENDRAPYLDPSLARIALQGFMPFTDDPNKQARYRRFLQVKAGEAKEYIPPPDKSMEEYEFHEFIQAARIFRPMSDQMASRFTRGQDSSSHQEENTTPPLEKKASIHRYDLYICVYSLWMIVSR
jgi:G patch domain-containing protein 1